MLVCPKIIFPCEAGNKYKVGRIRFSGVHFLFKMTRQKFKIFIVALYC